MRLAGESFSVVESSGESGERRRNWAVDMNPTSLENNTAVPSEEEDDRMHLIGQGGSFPFILKQPRIDAITLCNHQAESLQLIFYCVPECFC
jgi:hypothetical protein